MTVLGSVLRLSWIREPRREPPAHETLIPLESLVAPPRQAMLDLRELALQGSMRDILQWASRLIEIDPPRYRPFASYVRRLAEAYQSQALLKFVESHLAPASDVLTTSARR